MNRLEQMQKMVEQQPGDTFLRYAIALEYRSMGDFTRAISALRELRSLFPQYLPTYYPLTELLRDTGETEAATEVCEAGIRVAEDQQERKTAGELNSLLLNLED